MNVPRISRFVEGDYAPVLILAIVMLALGAYVLHDNRLALECRGAGDPLAERDPQFSRDILRVADGEPVVQLLLLFVGHAFRQRGYRKYDFRYFVLCPPVQLSWPGGAL